MNYKMNEYEIFNKEFNVKLTKAAQSIVCHNCCNNNIIKCKLPKSPCKFLHFMNNQRSSSGDLVFCRC